MPPEQLSGDGYLLIRLDERTENIERMLTEMCKKCTAHDEAIGDLEIETAKVKERMTIAQVTQAGLSTVLSVIAGWIGMNR